ncbi:MAG: DUF423 domain-containing protein, partial [Candidatus Marinimicrobia bacterium]|jgi:uncharacterized membrane protein YgdD (TMEM256/DUF423 family)|nr:DUF423 domain-containing protein [Candidatus Neomarinimicrobiota bacterium]
MNYLLFGAMSGCLVVIMGAFGAHALNELLDDYGKSIYNKAVLYHMFHTIAILILGLINKIQPEIQLSMAGWSFMFGIILFSGSLYIIAITGIKSLGIITPIGGILFIIGWVFLILKA